MRMAGPSMSAGVSTGGNTAGSTGTVSGQIVFVGASSITLSQSSTGGSATISLIGSVNPSFSAGVSTGGNTAGATGMSGTRVVLVGSNNISLSQTTDANGATVTINQTLPSMSIGLSTGGNTAGSTGVTGTRMVLVGTNAVSLSQATDANGGTVSINVVHPTVSMYQPLFPLLMSATQGIGASAATQTTVTAWVMPISFAQDLAFNNINVAVHNSFSSATTSISSVNYSYSMGASLGFYTLNVSTMSLVTSFSGSLGFTNATSAAATDLKASADIGWGGSSTTIRITGAANMSSIMDSISSVRKMGLNWSSISNTITAGQYWAVACFSQLTAGNNQASLTSIGMVSSHTGIASAYNPPHLGRSTASITSPFPFLGQATLVNNTNSLMLASFNTNVITTATALANSTKFQSIWFQIFSSHSN